MSSLSSPVVALLMSHIVETRRLLLKGSSPAPGEHPYLTNLRIEKEKSAEIKDDEGEEEVGWIITNPKVHDFLDKGDILLDQALQVLRHRHNAVRLHTPSNFAGAILIIFYVLQFANPSNEVKQFESLSLWEGEEALARCLYNQVHLF